MSLIPLLAFFAGAGFTALASRLRDFTAGPPRGLSDLIPWAFLIETGPNAAVLNKDGSFTAAFHLTGPDRASSIPEELAFLSDHTSRALSGFPNWTFHCDAIREAALDYPGPGAYPDPVTALLDEVRRQSYLARGQQYHSRVVLSATYRPPRASYRRLTNWLQVGATPSETTAPGLETLLSFFQDSLDPRGPPLRRASRSPARRARTPGASPWMSHDRLSPSLPVPHLPRPRLWNASLRRRLGASNRLPAPAVSRRL